MYGVSPAYFISRSGSTFTPADVAAGLPGLRALGYDAFQLEVYYLDRVGEWASGGLERVYAEADRLGLATSQFVGHCLLNGFVDDESLDSDVALAGLRSIVSMLAIERCPIVTVPLPAFTIARPAGGDATTAADVSHERSARRRDRLEQKLTEMARIVTGGGFSMGVELVPGGLLGDLVEVAAVLDRIGAALGIGGAPATGRPRLGINFDTGHAWAQKRVVPLLPALLGDRFLGTHLCDNFGHENLSLCPGDGSIDWPLVIRSLLEAGYSGSWDVEIHCPPDDVAARYGAGIERLHGWIEG